MEPDAGAEILGVAGDGDQGLGGGLEQDVVDHGFVLITALNSDRQVRHREE